MSDPTTTDTSAAHIVQLRAQNVKRLKAVSIRVDDHGRLVLISGRNGQGKTSVLDSIWWALGGSRAIQSVPIRKGTERAEIEVILGDAEHPRGRLRVTRSITEAGSYLRVESMTDGAEYKSPQKMLDDFLCALSLDPLEFARATPAERRAQILATNADLGHRLDQLAVEEDIAVQARRDAKRDLSKARGHLDSLEKPSGLPDERPDIQALQDQFDAAHELLRAHDADLATVTAAERTVSQADATATAAEARVSELEAQLSRARERAEQAASALVDAKDALQAAREQEQKSESEVPDIKGIRDAIAEARDLEERFACLDDYREAEETVAAAQSVVDQEEAAVAAARAARDALLADVQLPVDGLGIGDEDVTYRGVPFGQASDSEQLRASVEIAMALSPSLRIIRVRDGSLLDADSRKILADLAAERGYDIWMEVVESDDPAAIIIEDGAVVEPDADADAED